SLYNALAATCGPGDEVIIPSPYWVSYSDLVQMTGASYVLVQTSHESGFKMSPAQLRAALTPRTRLVMLNSPSNPTGTVYSRQEPTNEQPVQYQPVCRPGRTRGRSRLRRKDAMRVRGPAGNCLSSLECDAGHSVSGPRRRVLRLFQSCGVFRLQPGRQEGERF